MVRLTPEHWRVCEQRADGWSHEAIALENDLPVEQVKAMLADVARVVSLQMASQVGGGADGSDVGS